MMSVVIPAYNEASKIADTLVRLRRVVGKGAEILVVDDGSKDNTAAIARKYARVYCNKTNKGKGASMRIGAAKAVGDVLIFIDASQFDPADITRLVREFGKGGARIVNGARDFSTIPIQRRINNYLSKLAVFLATGKRVRDPLTGFRVMRRKDFLALGTIATRYCIEVEIVYKALLRGWKIREVPVQVSYAGMPGSRIGGAKAPFLSFFIQRFLHECWYNIKAVLKIWLFGKL